MLATLLIVGILLTIRTDVAHAVDGRPTGIVTTDEIRVQSEPGRHGLPQKTLQRGSRFKIIRHRQGWIQILHNGEVGFIKDLDQTIKIVQRFGVADVNRSGRRDSVARARARSVQVNGRAAE